MPVVRSSNTCMRYMPTFRLPVFGSRVITQGRVMNRPASLGQHWNLCTLGSFKQQGRAASSALRVAAFRNAVGYLGDLEYGINFSFDPFEFIVAFEHGNPFAEVVVGQSRSQGSMFEARLYNLAA